MRRHAGRLLTAARRLAGDEDEARRALVATLESAVRRADRRPRATTTDRWLLRLLVECWLDETAGREIAASTG